MKTIENNEPILEFDVLSQCIYCGLEGSIAYRDCDDFLYDVPGKWTYVRCPECGLLWLYNRPMDAEIWKLYSSYYTHADLAQPAIRGHIESGVPGLFLGYKRPRITSLLITALVGLFGPLKEAGLRGVMYIPKIKNGTLFDIGCGSGEFLAHMQELGWSVSGCDYDEKAVENAKGRLNSDRVYLGSFGDLSFKEKFDVVTSSHVIEHVKNPQGMLDACYEAIKPGGICVISTPNLDSRLFKKFLENWRGLEPPRHFFIFGIDHLKLMAKRAGFEVEVVRMPSLASLYIYPASVLIRDDGRMFGVALPENLSKRLRLNTFIYWIIQWIRVNLLGARDAEEIMITLRKPR